MFALQFFFSASLLACTSSDSSGATGSSQATGDQSEVESGGGVGGAVNGEAFPESVQLIVANSPGSVSVTGEQRIMTAVLGAEANSFLGGPDIPVTVQFKPIDGESEGGMVQADWLTTNASELGLYVSRFTFDEPGNWEITVNHGDRELGATLFDVLESSLVPQPGDLAPPSVTPTGASASEINKISTDLEPDPTLYDLTVAEAVGNGKQTMIVFATPAFCQTALCGPTLDFAKAASSGRTDLDVVHVEPFDLELAPVGTLEPIEAMFDYGLSTEPWIFIVDAEGKVSHSFEGIIGQSELEDALSTD